MLEIYWKLKTIMSDTEIQKWIKLVPLFILISRVWSYYFRNKHVHKYTGMK